MAPNSGTFPALLQGVADNEEATIVATGSNEVEIDFDGVPGYHSTLHGARVIWRRGGAHLGEGKVPSRKEAP